MKGKTKTIIIISTFFIISLATIEIFIYFQNNVKHTTLKTNDSAEIKTNQNKPAPMINNEENTINIEVYPFYGHEPNLEFLVNAADIIVSGIIDTSSLISEVENTFIYTNMDIKITNVYKNTTTLTHSNSKNNSFKTLNIKTIGGKLSAKDYIKSLDENENIKYSLTEEELEKYSFSLDSSNGKLNYKEENTEYLFFLNYVNGDLVPNSNHYGICKIKGTKVYDYETDSYIETALLD